MKKVSILMPVYNAEKYLAESLESALAQTWENKEIIVVDDGSQDDSLEIARSYESDILKVFSQENAGQCMTRNACFDKSCGDYIQYLDADDLLHPEKIKAQMDYLEAKGEDDRKMVYGTSEIFEDSIDELYPYPDLNGTMRGESFANPFDMLNAMFLRNSAVQPFAWLTPRLLIEESGGWDDRLDINTDGEFFSRALKNASGVDFVEGAIGYYRMLKDSKSKERAEKHYESECRALMKTCSVMLEGYDNADTRKACSAILSYYIDVWYPGNKPYLKELYLFMKRHGLEYEAAGRGSKFKLAAKTLGWYRAIMMRDSAKG